MFFILVFVFVLVLGSCFCSCCSDTRAHPPFFARKNWEKRQCRKCLGVVFVRTRSRHEKKECEKIKSRKKNLSLKGNHVGLGEADPLKGRSADVLEKRVRSTHQRQASFFELGKEKGRGKKERKGEFFFVSDKEYEERKTSRKKNSKLTTGLLLLLPCCPPRAR